MGGEEDPVEALARLAEELGMHAVIDLEVDLDGGAALLRSLPPDRRSDILFIAREALSQRRPPLGRVADARSCCSTTTATSSCASRTTARGFDPDAVPGPDALGRHQGLANMRDRAVGMGGTFAVERPDGPGTRIIVRVPATSTPHPGSVLPPAPEND